MEQKWNVPFDRKVGEMSLHSASRGPALFWVDVCS